MVCSMTAFARHVGEAEWSHAVWEIRSCNHRYLEISLRLPEPLRGLEAAVREQIGRYLQRGKVECSLRYEATSTAGLTLCINRELVRELAKACRDIDTLLPNPAAISAIDLLGWPGVIEIEAPDMDRIGGPLLGLLKSALMDLIEARRREGEKLRALIDGRCVNASVHVARLRERLPEILTGIKERLLSRCAELSAGVDPGRIEQEMLLLAQKLDVAEELDRLETHLGEVKRLLQEDGPVGRRLDFLMQEMNREANTMASKSVHVDTTGASVDLKVLIEQMREQIQNIE